MALGDMPPARLPLEQAPQPGPLRYGLYNVAPPIQIQPSAEDPNLPEHAFGGGIFYEMAGCGTAHPYEIECTPDGKAFDPHTPERQVLPFVVYATLECGPLGYRPADLARKTAGRLFANEQHAVENAFWAGGFGNAPIITDPVGAVDVGTGGVFADITAAVAALEAHAYNGYGYHAVLHANSAVHAYAADANLVHSADYFSAVWGAPKTDATLRTALGTKWVFGGGYPGTGPGGVAPGAGQTYIWITGNTTVWTQPSQMPPVIETMDRTLNQFHVLNEHGVLASYDCFHAYALVSIPEEAVGP